MQGLEGFIPTDLKVEYINALLNVGFDTIDFGSFVSPRAVPQMSDTAEVLKQLDLTTTNSKLLAIVANLRGATDASQYDEIQYLGYPLSISETFQQRNTNQTIVESLNMLAEMQDLCIERSKELVVYLSMGFGNPYGDPYDKDIVHQFVDILKSLEVRIISLADTVGSAKEEEIRDLFSFLIPANPEIEFGAHLHSNPRTSRSKIQATIASGCTRIDGALNGYGGCPFATDELTGNIATEEIISVLQEQNQKFTYDKEALGEAMKIAGSVFA